MQTGLVGISVVRTAVHMEAPVEPAEACVGAEMQDEALPGDIGFLLADLLGLLDACGVELEELGQLSEVLVEFGVQG